MLVVDFGVEVSVVNVLDKFWRGGVAHVEDRDPSNAFEADEGIGSAGNLSNDDTFRLRALVVATVVEGVVIVGGVKVGWVSFPVMRSRRSPES